MKYDFGGWATRNDLQCADGRVIKKDAFKGQNGQTVPLVWMHNHADPANVLGLAHLENRDEGVYAFCEFNDTESGKTARELVKHGDVQSLSIFANQLKQAGHDVVHGIIREVSLVLAGANPGAFIDDVVMHGDGETGIVIGYNEMIMGQLEHSADKPDKKKEKEKEQQAEQTVRAEEKPVEPAEQPEQEEKKQGLFSRLWQGLSKTRGNVAGRVDELIEATEKIDDGFYEDLVDILIMSDMGVRTSDKVIQELKARVEKEKITDAKKAREILKEILKEIMSMPRKPLKWPMVMLVVGVNGVGKTTTIGKLAMRFKDARHSVVLAAADTFRAAAGDQLQIWAERAQVPIVRHAEGADPAAVVFDGIQKAKATEADLLIVDTAGRLHNKKNLMEELRKISRVITREYEEAEVRTLLVIDATTGQNGLQQAREFSEVADVSGIVLTKLDGTAKGGIAVAIMDELKLPVLYIGVGEGIEDLQAFDANAFVDAIF